jgi:glycosyltransferase involved in cell wall biosynthesis
MKCSVIIPAYNVASYIAQALRSLLNQTHVPDEILVVDNGSADQTPSIVEAFGPPVRLINEPRRGAAIARNRGIREALGEFIAFLDADDICLPQRIDHQLQALSSNSKMAMVFCAMAYTNKNMECSGAYARCDDYTEGGHFGRLLERNRMGSTSVAMVRKKVLLDVGGFDEQITHNEEYDLWLRIAAQHQVIYLDETLIHYRIHSRNISHERKGQHYNEIRALEKYPIDFIQQAIKNTYPKDRLFQMKALAKVLLRLDKPHIVKSLLKELWSQGVREPELTFLYGVSLQSLGRENSAESIYMSCLSQSPEYPEVHNNLGVIQIKRGFYSDAREHFITASRINHNFSDPVFNLRLSNKKEKDDNWRITPITLRKNLKPDFSVFGY